MGSNPIWVVSADAQKGASHLFNSLYKARSAFEWEKIKSSKLTSKEVEILNSLWMNSKSPNFKWEMQVQFLAREVSRSFTPYISNAYQINLYNIVMVTEWNSVHKHSESPLHWSGLERETIPDYRGCRSHDLRNSGYRCRGSLENGQNYII